MVSPVRKEVISFVFLVCLEDYGEIIFLTIFFFSFLSPLQLKVSYHQYICYIDKIEIMNLYYLLANLFVWFSIPIKQ